MGMPTAEADFFLWHFRGMDASHGRRSFLTRTDEYKDILA